MWSLLSGVMKLGLLAPTTNSPIRYLIIACKLITGIKNWRRLRGSSDPVPTPTSTNEKYIVALSTANYGG
jgi:hypothetical protein